jgi:hypothetical protein
MSLNKFITLSVFTIIFSTPLVSLATNKLIVEKNGYDLLKNISIAKQNPVVKVKKPKQIQWNCTVVHGGNWAATNETISVGIKAFTALYKLRFNSFSMSPGLSYLQTCKFIVNPGNVKATYALPDNSTMTNAKITAYLDGEPVSSISISRGEADTLNVNTSGFKSMAVEVTVSFGHENLGYSTAYDDYIYIANE